MPKHDAIPMPVTTMRWEGSVRLVAAAARTTTVEAGGVLGERERKERKMRKRPKLEEQRKKKLAVDERWRAKKKVKLLFAI